MRPPILTRRDVRDLAAAGRVLRSLKYHAHVPTFGDVVSALFRCVAVRPDLRVDLWGRPRHPAGFIAHGPSTAGELLRIDFDLQMEADGNILYVVTAFRVRT